MKRNRMLSKVVALTLSLSLMTGVVFASEWFLDDGSITIDTAGGRQQVTQNERSEAAANPVITQRNSSYGIDGVITVQGNGTANFTIKDLNVFCVEPAIEVAGTTTANITAEGYNELDSARVAGIHITEGNLHLHVTENSTVTALGESNSAGIGTNKLEDFSGSIEISGPGTVNASGGAGIGTGFWGSITETGSIKTGEGKVNAVSKIEGAGIGSGRLGSMRGTIELGSGEVTAVSGPEDNPKIGRGAGIGSGVAGTMSGSIITGEGKVNAVSRADGAAIGAGGVGKFEGSITIGSGEITTEFHAFEENGVRKEGADIGGPLNKISPESTVTINKGAVINGAVMESDADLAGLTVNAGEIKVEGEVRPAPAAVEATDIPYWVLSQGMAVVCDRQIQDGILTVSCQLENADFHVTAAGLRFLQSQGIVAIVFHTAQAESRLAVGDVLQTLDSGALVLAHAGSQAALTLDGQDHGELIG